MFSEWYTSVPLDQLYNYQGEIDAAALSTPDSDFPYTQAGSAKNTLEFQKFKLGVNKDHNLCLLWKLNTDPDWPVLCQGISQFENGNNAALVSCTSLVCFSSP